MQNNSAEHISGGFTASWRLFRRAVFFSADKYSAAHSEIGGG